MDLHELRNYGKAHKMCPYYLARRMVEHCTVTVAPYQYIFNDAIRELIKLNLSGKILIFDEAHNADQISLDVLSDTLSGRSLDQARRELEQLEESTNLIDVLKNYLEMETTGEVRAKWGRELLSDLHRLLGEDLPLSIESFYGHIEAIRELKLSQGEIPISYLNGVLTFLSLVEESPQDSYVAVYKHSYYGVPLIEYRCLDPSLAIKPVIELSAGTLIMSGTLSPIELFSKVLGLNETENHVYSSIADEESVKTLVDSRVTSRYSKRGQAMMVRYGKRIAFLSEKIPNGALVFFPQRRMMMECVSNWRRNGILVESEEEVFMGSKKVFIEGANASENANIVEEYKRSTTTTSGAILLGVFRGRNAEGSNFPDEQARAVFLVGVPFADYSDPVVKAQIEYFNRKSKTLGEKWYVMDAYRAANQAMGRGIRHKDDWCNFILMDSRYENNLKLISSWALQNGVQRLPRYLS
jgi:Rad3-related DNA helicase